MANDETQPKKAINIKCEKVTLLWSDFHHLDPESEENLAKFDFSIKAEIFTDFIFSKLEVKIVNQVAKPQEQAMRQSLDFCIAGMFSPDGEHTSKDLSDFARAYSLTILWPYAREYATDVLQRSGVPFPILPIINPQILTEKMNKAELINITIHNQSIKSVGSPKL